MRAVLPDMVSLAGGTISLKDARRGTERHVALQPFDIAVAPVTRAEFSDIGGAARTPGTPGTEALGSDDALPAVSISWLEAVTWCNRASDHARLTRAYTFDDTLVRWEPHADGYRLPTEAEWEYACRAGTEGPTYGPLADIAWTSVDAIHGPRPVRLKNPNGFGLYDMLGNAWEWCWDYVDPARYFDYRTLKGGGWCDPPWNCRVGVRRGSMPGMRLDDVGFRIARGATTVAEDGLSQGWSAEQDRNRAAITGPIPVGWTPLRDLLDEATRVGQGRGRDEGATTGNLVAARAPKGET